MDGGKVIDVAAFFDTKHFDAFWSRQRVKSVDRNAVVTGRATAKDDGPGGVCSQ